MQRAMQPALVFESGCIAETLRTLPLPFILLAQPEPLQLLPADARGRAATARIPPSLARRSLEDMEATLPEARAVVGIGGGSAMDAAKYVAWRRGTALYLAPSIISVDAFVTNTIAVRDEGQVHYDGFVVANKVLVDFDLIHQAPPHLNRAGVGDLLSIHTALWDWEHGSDRESVPFDAEFAARARRTLRQVTAAAASIRDVTDAGLETVVRAYAEVNALCLLAGSSAPEEGSEHYFAYLLERLTGRSFIHGEVIALGVMLMSALQRNDVSGIRAAIHETGVRWRPEDLRIGRDDLVRTLLGLRDFVREAALPWSVVDEADLTRTVAESLVNSL